MRIMKNYASAVAISALVVMTVVSGCKTQSPIANQATSTESPKSGPVLATFSGRTITQGEFLSKLEALPKNVKAFVFKNKKQFVEDMVSEELLVSEAEKKGVQNDQEVQSLLAAARKKILTSKLIEMEVDSKLTVSAEEVQKFYNDNKGEFVTPELLRASHILVKTKEEANALKTQLNSGADFEQLARDKSIDNTAIRGGDLEYFQKGQFVPEFEQAAFALKKGQVSDVVQTKFGFHIIKLTDRIASSQRDFEQVQKLIETRLKQQKRADAVKSLIDKARKGVNVSLNDKAIDALGPQEAVPAAAVKAVK